MGLVLMLTLGAPLDASAVRAIGGLARVKERSVNVFALKRVRWRRVFDVIESAGARVASFRFDELDLEGKELDWRKPPVDVAGAVLRGVCGVRPTNPPEDFERRPPAPHQGEAMVKRATPIHVDKRPPKDLVVVEVGEELIFARRFTDLLGGPPDGGNLGDRDLLPARGSGARCELLV
jgi:hypothetical protein